VNLNEAAVALAARIRHHFETRSFELLSDPEVMGAGLAWRDGAFCCVVLVRTVECMESIKSRYPDAIDGFRIRYETF
jgi:hypothetical protein